MHSFGSPAKLPVKQVDSSGQNKVFLESALLRICFILHNIVKLIFKIFVYLLL